MKYLATIGESKFNLEVDGKNHLKLGDQEVEYNFRHSTDPTLFSLILGDRSYELRIVPEEDHYVVLLDGISLDVTVEDERTRMLAGVKRRMGADSGKIVLKAPMPGAIIDVLVKPGDKVESGQTLVILESMKMHNEFKAQRAATVSELRISTGDKVNQGETMIILE